MKAGIEPKMLIDIDSHRSTIPGSCLKATITISDCFSWRYDEATRDRIGGGHTRYVPILTSHQQCRLTIPGAAVPTTSHKTSRALSNSSSGGYAPGAVDCPSGPFLRSAQKISDGEASFVKARHKNTNAALEDFMVRANMTDFDIKNFLNDYSPTIGLAFSGGGYRAMLSGGGAVKAMDARTPGATDRGKGQIGGLLQSATYMAGLSGGSWLVGSVVVNNFTTIGDLQASETLWNLKRSVLFPKNFKQIRKEVDSKAAAGFDITLTDYWGRVRGNHIRSLGPP